MHGIYRMKITPGLGLVQKSSFLQLVTVLEEKNSSLIYLLKVFEVTESQNFHYVGELGRGSFQQKYTSVLRTQVGRWRIRTMIISFSCVIILRRFGVRV